MPGKILLLTSIPMVLLIVTVRYCSCYCTSPRGCVPRGACPRKRRTIVVVVVDAPRSSNHCYCCCGSPKIGAAGVLPRAPRIAVPPRHGCHRCSVPTRWRRTDARASTTPRRRPALPCNTSTRRYYCGYYYYCCCPDHRYAATEPSRVRAVLDIVVVGVLDHLFHHRSLDANDAVAAL